jgi:hypothetical protein
MLNVLAIQPPLRDLYNLIDKIPKYPVSNRQLVDFASKVRAPKEVVDFYRTFNDDRVFKSRNELTEVSEQVDMMRQQESDTPQEFDNISEEY